MKEVLSAPQSCCCSTPKVSESPTGKTALQVKHTFRAASGTFVSLLIAFFPKCPVCWAAYMSMFGSFGLTHIPYMKWLLPVLVTFLGIHLVLMYMQSKGKGYWPFVLSCAGAALVVGGRSMFASNKTVLVAGMLLILAGSLWNSLSTVYARWLKTRSALSDQ